MKQEVGSNSTSGSRRCKLFKRNKNYFLPPTYYQLYTGMFELS